MNDLIEDSVLGPAMQALNSRQRAFVVATVRDGLNGSRAAAAAGFSGDPATLKSTAYRLSHTECVQKALLEEGQRALRGAVPLAITTLTELAAHPDPAVARKAAESILDRAGLPKQSEQRITVERPMNRREQIETIVALAREEGLDPRAMLGRANIIVDAEFREVKPALPAPDDLSDLLAPSLAKEAAQ